MKKQIKSEKAPPRAKRLIQSLRGLGYSPETALADLIDNSITAEATEIHVNIHCKEGKVPAHIFIMDNGDGMDRDQLKEAMRYGSGVEYSPEELGRFGLGLKTASLSQCSVLTVSTKPKPRTGTRSRTNVARWDLVHVFDVDDWDLLFPEMNQIEEWESEILDQGLGNKGWTTVLWSDLSDQLSPLNSSDLRERQNFHAHLLQQISNHLATVFHMYLQGAVPHKSRIRIYVSGNEVSAWDPFCREEPKVKELSSFKPQSSRFGLNAKSRVVFKPCILPPESEFSTSKAFDKAAGIRGWNFQQGFYFYRNYRMIQSGGWSRMRKPDEHLKLLRIGVFFSGEYDEKFAINITKMKCSIPPELRNEIKNLVYRGEWSSVADSRYRKKERAPRAEKPEEKERRPEKSTSGPALIRVGAITLQPTPTQTGQLSVTQGATAGSIKILVPQNHEISTVFHSRTDELTQLCFAMMAVLEAVVAGQIKSAKIPVDTFKRRMRKLL